MRLADLVTPGCTKALILQASGWLVAGGGVNDGTLPFKYLKYSSSHPSAMPSFATAPPLPPAQFGSHLGSIFGSCPVLHGVEQLIICADREYL